MVRVIRNKYEDNRYLAVLLFVPDSAHTRRIMCLMQTLFTFASYRGGWIWLVGGGAWKLRHSLTTGKISKSRSLISLQIRVLKLVIFFVFVPEKQIVSLSVTSSHPP